MIGLLQQSPQAALAVLRPAAATASASSDDTRIKTLLAAREQARRDRDFSRADALREALEAAGFMVEDTPDGPRLRPAPSVPA
jgi:cysteinyl-tRNA synthetase